MGFNGNLMGLNGNLMRFKWTFMGTSEPEWEFTGI